MSTLFRCDFCLAQTSAKPNTWTTIELPHTIIPEVLKDTGTGTNRKLDICNPCKHRVSEALNAVVLGHPTSEALLRNRLHLLSQALQTP